MIICYTVPEIWRVTHDTYDFYFSFWTTFCPLQPKKKKYQKNEINTWRYHHFTPVCAKNYDEMIYGS